MATTKKITMKQFNGTDYDTLYPKTIAAQITGTVPIASGGTNGTTAPSGVNNLVAGLSQITPVSNDLFPFRDVSGNTGGSVTLTNLATALGNNGVITPSNLAEQSSALGFTKIQTGSYVGTGTYGKNNPCSLTFDFAPKFVMIPFYTYDKDNVQLPDGTLKPRLVNIYNSTSYNWIMFSAGLRTEYGGATVDGSTYGWDYNGFGTSESASSAGMGTRGKKSADGKTFYWYQSSNASGQLNQSDYTYYWYAFG